MTQVIRDERVKTGVVELIVELTKDPEVYEAAMGLVHRVLAEEGVKAQLSELLLNSSHKVAAAVVVVVVVVVVVEVVVD